MKTLWRQESSFENSRKASAASLYYYLTNTVQKSNSISELMLRDSETVTDSDYAMKIERLPNLHNLCKIGKVENKIRIN